MIIEHVLKFIIKPKNNDSQFTSPRHIQLHNVSNTNFWHLDAYKIIQRRINCRNYHY